MRSPRLCAFLFVAAAAAAGCRQRPAEPAEWTWPGAPVVLISIDTLRSDHLPAYGYPGVATPAIDALRRDAVLYTHAYSHYPLTLPSHVSLLSGELPPVHGVRDNAGFHFDAARHPDLPLLLKAAGYDTGAVVSATLLNRGTGLAAGFDLYDDRVAGPGGGDEAKRPGSESVRAAGGWLRRRGGRPFFLFLHLYEPHAPYRPPPPFAERYRQAPYDGEIAAADAAVGELLAELKRLGLYDRAVVALLSDHGEGLGEHGERFHGMFLYRETLQVPLLLKLPGRRLAGSTVAAPAALIDVMPTLLRLAGTAVPPGLPGEDLVRMAAAAGIPGPATGIPAPVGASAAGAPKGGIGGIGGSGGAWGAGERPIYAETLWPRLHYGWSELTSLIRGPLHLQDGPEPELFDLAADPGETVNLLEQRRRDFAAMRAAIRSFYLPPAAPRPADAETVRRLGALGYLAAGAAPARGPLPDPRGRRADLAAIETAVQTLEDRGPAAAVPLFERLLATNPRLVDVRLLLAALDQRLGRKAEAAAAYRQAVAAADNAPAAALIAARQLLKLGRPDEALAFAALARDGAAGTGASATAAPSTTGAGNAGDAGAAHGIGHDLAADPATAAAGAALVVEIALARGDLDGALAALRQGAVPAGADERRAVGVALAQAGRAAEALALLEPLAGGGDPETLDALATALIDRGRLQEAAAALGRVVKAAPRDARAHQLLGAVALHLDQPAAAARQLELSVQLDPRQAVAWNMLGVARLRVNGPAAALAAWERAVALAPDYWEALFNVGQESAAIGRRDEARQALRRFAAQAPPDLFAAEIERARALLRGLES